MIIKAHKRGQKQLPWSCKRILVCHCVYLNKKSVKEKCSNIDTANLRAKRVVFDLYNPMFWLLQKHFRMDIVLNRMLKYKMGKSSLAGTTVRIPHGDLLL